MHCWTHLARPCRMSCLLTRRANSLRAHALSKSPCTSLHFRLSKSKLRGRSTCFRILGAQSQHSYELGGLVFVCLVTCVCDPQCAAGGLCVIHTCWSELSLPLRDCRRTLVSAVDPCDCRLLLDPAGCLPALDAPEPNPTEGTLLLLPLLSRRTALPLLPLRETLQQAAILHVKNNKCKTEKAQARHQPTSTDTASTDTDRQHQQTQTGSNNRHRQTGSQYLEPRLAVGLPPLTSSELIILTCLTKASYSSALRAVYRFNSSILVWSTNSN